MINKPKLSVIIPSRNSTYLQRTIDNILANARGEIEIIVVLDGYTPHEPVKEDPRVIVLSHGSLHENFGMRASINLGVSISRGEFIMKTDEHCIFSEGFDVTLTETCEDDWVVSPKMYKLHNPTWSIVKKFSTVDNAYITYPYPEEGLEGRPWKEMNAIQKDIPIVDAMMVAGSCYLMSKKHWDKIGELDSSFYGSFHFETQEICLKTWLGGGRVRYNKNAWFAHHHRNKHEGKGYNFSQTQINEFNTKEKIRGLVTDYWVGNGWPDRIHDFEWLIEKFYPIPGWKDTWRNDLIRDRITKKLK